MSVLISDLLQQMFDVREHEMALLEKLNLADKEYKSNAQRNAGRRCVEVHDLDVTQKILKKLSDIRQELLTTNAEFEQKKKWLIELLHASGGSRLQYSNKEWLQDGTFHYVPYTLSLVENDTDGYDLLIDQDELTAEPA